jgi:hypothetical protein
MNDSAQLLKHLVIIGITALVITAIYSKVTGAYFCSYDEFIEVHRAAFEDTRAPLRVFTTPHFSSYKYRPLNRAVNLLTYWVGNGDTIYFRIRNLISHIINVALAYMLGWLLFRNILISSIGSLLFGLHPLVNQTIIGTVMTNAMAHTFFLLSLVTFIIAIHSRQYSMSWLIPSLASGWVSLLFYDSEITIYLMMVSYLVLYLMMNKNQAVNYRFISAFAVGSIISLSSYFLLRAFFVPHGWGRATGGLSTIGPVVKSLAIYGLGLLLPMDIVLANEWLHIPPPLEIEFDIPTGIIISMLAIVSALALVLIVRRWTNIGQSVIHQMDWARVVFLLAGIVIPLMPALAFRSYHPSETYLYLSVAFYALLLSYVLVKLLWDPHTSRSQAAYTAVVIVLLGLFCAANWVRNNRVVQCGETARRIISSLHNQSLTDGVWTLSFANVPGERASSRYGFYGYHGIDTIGFRSAANNAITAALQLAYKNESLTGEVVKAEELTAICQPNTSPQHHCFWVHWDGRVEKFQR